MALVLADRVRETTTTAGTGAVSLGGAVSGFQSFSTAIGDANNTYYTIADSNTGAWEVGIGTYTSSGNTLSRDTVLSSSNAGNLVSFAANAKDVFVTQPAERAVYLDTATNATVPGLTVNGTQTITVNSASDALRITQTGTGNALVVEDSTNPDSTPFVVDANGGVIVGNSTVIGLNYTSAPRFQVAGTSQATTALSSVYAGSGTNLSGSLLFGKSTGTLASPTAVISGDDLGRIQFEGHDGTAFIPSAQILAEVDGTPGTNDMPGRLVFSTTADGASSPTEAMRIGSAGTIGVGVTNAASYTIRTGKNITGGTSGGNFYASGTVQSDVTSNGYGFLAENKTAAASFTLGNFHGFRASQGTFGAGSTVTNQFGFQADSTLIGATNNYGFYSNIASGTGRWNFYANGTAANYFAGNVGIGTTSLSALLTINSETDTTAYNGSATDGQLTAGATQLIRAAAGANTNVAQLVFQSRASQPFNRIVSSGGTAPFMAFATNNAERARIDSSGNVGIGTTSPTAKLEVYDASSAVARVTAGTEIFEIRNTGSEVRLAVVSADPMTFRTSNVEAMRIDSSGNVGIGNTAANVNDQVGAVRPLLVSKSDTSTTIAGSQANIVIGNADTTTNNTSQLSFAAITGANTTYFASAAINCVFGARTNGQYPTGQLTFSTSTSLNSAPTEKMRIDSSGNVGIGTSSPRDVAGYVSLGLNDTTGSLLDFYANGTRIGGITGVSGNMQVGTVTAIPLIFNTDTNERARIDSSGNFCFGTTSTTVNPGVSVLPTGRINIGRSNDDAVAEFYRSGTRVGQINVTTTATSYITSSDYRLKENIAPMTGALAKVAALNPCTYTWKADGSAGQGFIAHELAEVCPQAVVGEKDAVDAEGNPVYQGIDTSFLVATLTAAIQELKAELDATKAEVAALKGA